jgi:glycine/D-amino acid oxidase-like deaminating enzyme
MVCLARSKLPSVGALQNAKGLWAAMCFHGNGVAMGCYAGHMVADLVLERDTDRVPRAMRDSLAAFPLGRSRRALMPPLYAALHFRDRR